MLLGGGLRRRLRPTQLKPAEEELDRPAEVRVRVPGEGRVGGDRAEAVGLDALLQEQGIAEDEVKDRRRGALGSVAIMPAFEGGDESAVSLVRAEAEGSGAEHHIRSVSVGEERIPYRDRFGAGRLAPIRAVRNPALNVGLDAVGDCREQGLLVLEVPVEGAGLDVERGRESPHRQVGQPVVVEEAQRDVDHGCPIVARCRVASGDHVLTILNAVHLNTVHAKKNARTQTIDTP